MMLKMRTKKGGYVYIDNLYRIDKELVKKSEFRKTEMNENTIWIEDSVGVSKNKICKKVNKKAYHVVVQKYMYDFNNIRTVQITSYIMDSGYILNDEGKTVEGIHRN